MHGLQSLLLQVFKDLIWTLSSRPLQETRGKDDGKIAGGHLVNVLVLCKPERNIR